MSIQLVPTDDVLSPDHLLDVLGIDQDESSLDLEETGGIVQVCAGAWKLEPDGELWRFWKDPEWDE